MIEGHQTRFRPVHDGTAVVDGATGLVWQRGPADAPEPWAEAAAAAADGWRLPSVGELMHLLAGLPEPPPFGQGSVFWSASESPFAPASCVRGILYEGSGRFVILLLDKAERARRWLVRERP
jgi:hypothetical protein